MLLAVKYAPTLSNKPRLGCCTVTRMYIWHQSTIFSVLCTHNTAAVAGLHCAREMPSRMRMEKEYSQAKGGNNGDERRVEPGGATLCIGSRIME